MKRNLIVSAVLFLCSASTALSQSISTGVSISGGRLSGFHLAIGDYYHVPESRVVYVRDHYRIPDEELPVVFYVASRARVDPKVLIDLRIRNRMSWLDITFHYGLTPEIYYVPVARVGPPYGKAYGYYKKHKNNYKRVMLVDDDVINLVNLRFMSEYHGIPPERVMEMRGKGETFVVMNNNFREEKARHRDNNGNGKGEQNNGKDKGNKNQGKGKGKG